MRDVKRKDSGEGGKDVYVYTCIYICIYMYVHREVTDQPVRSVAGLDSSLLERSAWSLTKLGHVCFLIAHQENPHAGTPHLPASPMQTPDLPASPMAPPWSLLANEQEGWVKDGYPVVRLSRRAGVFLVPLGCG